MSLSNAQLKAKMEEMFPPEAMLCDLTETPNERIVFNRYGLSEAARSIAMFSRRQHEDRAATIYRMIAGTL